MLAQISSTFSSGRARTAAIVEGVASHAFCMACARLDTNTNPSSKERAPAATKAENSPKEWPATMSGWNASPNVFAKITEWRKIAGCVTFVCFRSSSVPANIRSVMRNPKISFAFSNSSLARAFSS